ncbi:MAG: Asp-tRNA(Asn)/Glu-tRNA(Gln) amidotransferase subunit GatC [Oscillospiraceae bacterium]|nr:Asp-tRNA(Asn)/Glu-tRNA(Gln) amidotransferase subunit GatC [Oscillospiraceae bacterium]
MRITDEMVQSLAELSQIELSADWRGSLAEEIGQTLAYINVLHNLNTDGTEPLVYLGTISNVMRPDVLAEPFDRALLLQNAPQHTEEAFVVPKIVG